MQLFSPPTIRLLHKIHRWSGLLLAAFIIFYCITGLLLNHRKSFNYFQAKETQTVKVEKTDPTLLQPFIDTYKRQIQRQDDPKVIRIKPDRSIEFLYGSHGKTTYVIKPAEGIMEIIEKKPMQPMHWFNQLHKVFQTSTSWLVLGDSAALIIMVVVISGLLLPAYRRVDLTMALTGLLGLIIGAILA